MQSLTEFIAIILLVYYLDEKFFMKYPIVAFTTLLTVTLATSSVVYADEQGDKQAIIEAYRALKTAVERKDVNQVYAYYAPEYTLIRQNGKLLNLEQSRQDTQQYFQTIRQINVHDEIKQIQINGQTATVIGIGYSSAIISNPKNPQVPVPVSAVSQYQDIWKRTSSGWKVISTHVLNQNVAVGQQQSSQGNRQKLTPEQRQLLIEQEQMLLNQMIRNGEMQRNMFNCMNGIGYKCGDSIITP
ncbi:nuclear transport factor 2 family protein [Nostoc sp. UIC 10890]